MTRAALGKRLNSSRGLVTHHLLSVVMVLVQELLGGEVAEGLVWSYSIIDVFPFTEGLVEFSKLEGGVCEFVEFLGMGSLGPFHMPVELG